MIYICLKGPFESQLYQFGAALRMAKKNINLIKINLRYLPNQNDFRLYDLFSKEDLPDFIADSEMILNPLSGRTFLLQDNLKGEFIDQSLLDTPLELGSNHVILDGHFQSGKNLAVLREYIYQDAVFSRSSLLNEIKPMPKDTIVAYYEMEAHLKEKNNDRGLINLSYLDSAIEKLWDKQNELVIYSDGNEISNRYGNKNNIKTETEINKMDTYKIMLSATTIIIPNSTFHLSAAFLSPYIKKICRPLIWSQKKICDDLTNSIRAQVISLPNTFYSFS
jgi:hypothetical protein